MYCGPLYLRVGGFGTGTMLTGLISDLLRGLLASKAACGEAALLLKSNTAPADRIRERLPALLASRSWEVRNLAVKLIEKLRDPEFYPILTSKLLNGNESGIVLRNTVAAVRHLGLRDEQTEEALGRALHAGYWEVRCEAARALSEMFEPTRERAGLLVQTLRPCRGRGGAIRFGERNFEVRSAVAVALGRCSDGSVAQPVLEALAEDQHWMVRHQAAVALVELSRRCPGCAPAAAQTLERIDLLGDGCRSDFPFPQAVASLQSIVLNGLAHTDAAAIRKHYIDMKRGWNRRTRA